MVTVTKPAIITTANLKPLNNKTVGEPTIMNVIISNPVPLEADCRIKIVFPVEIPISNSEPTSVSSSGFLKIDAFQSFLVKDIPSRTVMYAGC